MTARRLSIALLCTAAAGVIAGSPAPAVAKTKDPCVKKGRTTVGTTSLARVFSRGSSLYVCLRQNGRLTRLFEADDQYKGGAVQALTGRFVAYDFTEFPACKEACPPGVETFSETTVVDAKTGRRTRLFNGNAAKVVLTRLGSAAWLQGNPKAFELHVRDSQPARVVDSGDIAIRSLKASGGTLRWTNAGAAKSVAFR